ncbi:hypothetical protein [Litorisediminicola beolgyonensis]|uniref:5-aminolevulinate synthase n=1 Tax=Litorisediminicola beolgyonensis TaxID=1173614 RepID=A0ABW3ZF18_9RHOB
MSPSVALFALISALFYCLAMLVMKSWAAGPSLIGALLIAGALLAAGAFEIAALRHERLGLIYVVILGAEVVVIAGISLFHFGETYSPREIAGIAIVLLGTAVAWA